MGSGGDDQQAGGTWFIPDRPIDSPADDEFSHDTIADLLTQGVRDSVAPATIGLLGQFGAGKSSVANLAIVKLKLASEYDAVHVSAEKHSGEARSRNIVHSIAGDMVNRGYITRAHVNSRLRSLRMSVHLSTPAPGEMRISRLFRDPKGQSLKDVWFLLGVGVVLFAVLTLAAVLVGDPLDAIFSTSGVLTFVLLIGVILYRQITAVIESFFAVPTQQESTQRAEAADDVERVFADIVEHHWDKRGGRRLVVFVDDIDRLGPADVLDAMRAIKSLQAVPQGKEPIFVVSCDEHIVLTALTDATSTGDEAEAIDPEIGLASADGVRPRAALGYLDKFFSLRINLPPHVEDDMSRFVTTMLPSGHSIRHKLEVAQMDSVLLVLSRGDIPSPRHLVHRLNRFLADYRLVEAREQQPAERRRLHPGDATGRPIMLARLAVLSLDFPKFFASLLSDEALLQASDKLARRDELNEVERELLVRHKIACPTDAESKTPLEWAESEALRTYLVSTFPSVERGGGSLVPLLYLAEPEGGRILGNETLGLLVRAVRNGDSEQVELALDRIPEAQIHAATTELISVVGSASAAELPAVLAGASSAVKRIGSSGALLADSIADRAVTAPPGTMETAELLSVAEAGSGGHEHGLLGTVATAPPGEEADERNERTLLLAGYLTRRPEAPHIEDAISGHLKTIDEHGGWELVPAWIEIAALPEASGSLKGRIAASSLRLARATPDLAYDQSCESIVDVVSALPESQKESLRVPLRDLAPQSEGAFRLLVELRSAGCPPATANDALALAKAVIAIDDDGLRADAVRLVAGIVGKWKKAEFKKNDSEDPASYVADKIGSDLSDELENFGPLSLGALAEVRTALSAAPRALDKLAETTLEVIRNAASEEAIGQAWQTWVTAVSESADSLSDAEGFSSGLLEGFEQSGDLSPKTSSLLPQISCLSSTGNGEELLRPIAKRWNGTIAGATAPYTREPQVAAFRSLAAVDEALAEETVAPCLVQLTQRINQRLEIATHLEMVAALPWPEPQAAQAIALVGLHLEELSNVTDVVDLLSRIGESAEPPEAVMKRLFDASQEQPAEVFPSADRVWQLFPKHQQDRLLAKACGVSTTADRRLVALASDRLPNILVSAHLEGRLADVCQAGPSKSEVEVSTTDVLECFIYNEVELSPVDLELLRGYSVGTDDAVVDALIERVDSDSPYAELAVGYLRDLEATITKTQFDRLDEIVVDRLTSWSVPTAAAAAAVRRDRDLGADLQAVVQDLLKGPDLSRSVAQAITPPEKRKRKAKKASTT
jgi:hypothetical protein